MDIKTNMERNAKLKYRGCNHPGMSRMSISSTSSGSMKRAASLDQLPKPETGGAISRGGRRSRGGATRGKSPDPPHKQEIPVNIPPQKRP